MLGVKLASVVAGFAGGVVSLSFVKELTKTQAALAVLTGSLSAGYLTPVITQLFIKFIPELVFTVPEPSIAFIVGLTAMNIIPGIIKLAEMFKRNPEKFINRGGK